MELVVKEMWNVERGVYVRGVGGGGDEVLVGEFLVGELVVRGMRDRGRVWRDV